jgi:lipopolysaccharide transport system ATP-binding protein
MLCGTLTPTEGSIDIRGKVAALLELGAGFNTEFTGRENLRVSAAVMGLTEAELAERIDEIIAFADIGPFIDQPVKTYSSGMFVRLAFAVQTAVQPDVLIVDEALAVGDAPFQAKCYRRIADLVSKGTAVLFVSHDTGLIRELCHHAVWLHQGQLRMAGDVKTVTNAYTEFVHAQVESDKPKLAASALAHKELAAPKGQRLVAQATEFTGPRWGEGGARLTHASLWANDENPNLSDTIEHAAGCAVRVACELIDAPSETGAPGQGKVALAFSWRSLRGTVLLADSTAWRMDAAAEPGAGGSLTAEFQLPMCLAPGEYQVSVAVELWHGKQIQYLDFVESALFFKVEAAEPVLGLVRPPMQVRWL